MKYAAISCSAVLPTTKQEQQSERQTHNLITRPSSSAPFTAAAFSVTGP